MCFCSVIAQEKELLQGEKGEYPSGVNDAIMTSAGYLLNYKEKNSFLLLFK